MNFLIAICTEGKRKNIETLIFQIESMILAKYKNVRLGIILNEDSSIFDLKKYVIAIESRKGLANVRNKAILNLRQNENIVFIDDDQLISNNWFEELYKCFTANQKALVASNVKYIFQGKPADTSMWDKKKYNNRVATTNGLLIPSVVLRETNIRFNSDFVSIGDDSEFTFRLTKMGIPIKHAELAIIYEIVPESRTSPIEVFNRKLLASTAYSKIIFLHGTLFEKFYFISVTLLKIFFYFFTEKIFKREYKNFEIYVNRFFVFFTFRREAPVDQPLLR